MRSYTLCLVLYIRISLTSKHWLDAAYAGVSEVTLAPDGVPLHFLVNSSPTTVTLNLPVRDLSLDDKRLVARLLRGASSVTLSAPVSWDCELEIYMGCLGNAHTLHIQTNILPADFAAMLADSSQHPLRHLSVQDVFYDSAPYPNFKESGFKNLTSLHISDSFAPYLSTKLHSLTSLQRLVLEETDYHSDMIKICCGDSFDPPLEYVASLTSILPPQLAEDLSKVKIVVRSMQFSADAVLFAGAPTEQEVKTVFAERPPKDLWSAVVALCLFSADRHPSADITFKIFSAKIRSVMELGFDLFQKYELLGPKQPLLLTAFHLAVMHGTPVLVDVLYAQIQCPDAAKMIRDSKGYTPLHYFPYCRRAWLRCYRWHKTNFEGWRNDDADNETAETPLIIICRTAGSWELICFLSLMLQMEPGVLESGVWTKTFSALLSRMFTIWKDEPDCVFNICSNILRHAEPRLLEFPPEELAALPPSVLVMIRRVNRSLFSTLATQLPSQALIETLELN